MVVLLIFFSITVKTLPSRQKTMEFGSLLALDYSDRWIECHVAEMRLQDSLLML